MRSNIVVLLLAMCLTPFTAAAQNADTTARAIERLFEPWRDTESPGCAVGVSKDHRVVYQRGFGMANLETATPIRAGTVFHAASLAKQFTAMSVMLLVQDGKLSLDDDVRRTIPELPNYGRVITIRHLLTHTSGLRDFFEMLILARGRFEENRITEADLLDVVTRQRALNFSPGDEYLYNNTGYALASIIVKRVSGQSLREFAAARIFAPLGMSSTHFHDDFTMLVPGRASGYARTGSGWRASAPNYDISGPTSLFTNVEDLLKWSANLDAPRIGDTTIVRMMTTPAVLNNGYATSYGLGLGLWTDRGMRVVEHEGGDPGFRSFMGRYPDQRITVAVLCNHRSVDPVWIGHQIANLYLNMAPAAAFKPPVAPLSTPDVRILERRAGVYFQPRRVEVVELTVRNGKLYTARNGGAELQPVDSNTFLVAGRPVEHVFEGRANSDYVARSLVPGHEQVRFMWQQPFVLRPGVLKVYAGRYYSAELNSTYTVTAGDSTIVLRTGTSQGLTARPVFGDTFVAGQYTIQFQRKKNVITGFELSHPRARRLRFEARGQDQ